MERRKVAESIAGRFKRGSQFLSHEIRNQLHFHVSSLEEFANGSLSEEKEKHKQQDQQHKHEGSAMQSRFAEMARGLLSSFSSITAILNRVLDMAKLEANEFPINKTDFLLSALHVEVRTLCASKGTSLEIALSSFVASDMCDSNRILLTGDQQVSEPCHCTESLDDSARGKLAKSTMKSRRIFTCFACVHFPLT